MTEDSYYVHESSYIDDGVIIGKETKIWHFCHIMRGSVIGNNVTIGQNCVIGPNVTIGNNCKIQNNVHIFEGVTIEDFVFIGPSVVFTNVKYPNPYVKAEKWDRTIVKSGSMIGANSTIICPCVIGKNVFIGAGSVVTKDVPNHVRVFGNPAKMQ